MKNYFDEIIALNIIDLGGREGTTFSLHFVQDCGIFQRGDGRGGHTLSHPVYLLVCHFENFAVFSESNNFRFIFYGQGTRQQ